jgi:SAM-dependent methyltransferase
MSFLINDTDKDWEKWARCDPYFAVFSRAPYRRQNFASNVAEFFDSGEEFISRILDQAENAIGRQIEKGQALDFGCGVGRLAIPLARRFDRVVGVDVSSSMLMEARKNCERFGISNVEFHISDDSLSSLRGQFDFVNSYIVLQHIPPSRGYRIIERLLTLVGPRGCAMLHVSVRRRSSNLKKAIYFTRHRVPLASVVFNVLRGRVWNEPFTQMNEYDLLTVLEIFTCKGMEDVWVTLEPHGDVSTARLLSFRTSA